MELFPRCCKDCLSKIYHTGPLTEDLLYLEEGVCPMCGKKTMVLTERQCELLRRFCGSLLLMGLGMATVLNSSNQPPTQPEGRTPG